MADDGIPDDLSPELLERIQEMREDETIDFESSKRHDEGWLKVYVECPDCEVPMSRTTVESETIGDEDAEYSDSCSKIRTICPQCHTVEAQVTVEKHFRPYDAEDITHD